MKKALQFRGNGPATSVSEAAAGGLGCEARCGGPSDDLSELLVLDRSREAPRLFTHLRPGLDRRWATAVGRLGTGLGNLSGRKPAGPQRSWWSRALAPGRQRARPAGSGDGRRAPRERRREAAAVARPGAPGSPPPRRAGARERPAAAPPTSRSCAGRGLLPRSR